MELGRTGAERYFRDRLKNAEYRDAYETVRRFQLAWRITFTATMTHIYVDAAATPGEALTRALDFLSANRHGNRWMGACVVEIDPYNISNIEILKVDDSA